jgi:3-isopropylmalate/(R)-2-methylmalate dehydratase small subunit
VEVPRFIKHTGIAAPFLRSDVEVEVIAPLLADVSAHHAHGTYQPAPSSHSHSESPIRRNETDGQHIFEGIRFRPDGTEDPGFILNQAPYRNASILLAGNNFGIGSIQAFAAMRLRACGMRVVIASSFGPVFYDDCFVYGILPVTLPSPVVTSLAAAVAANPSLAMTVDLERQTIERPGTHTIRFELSPRLRSNLLRGVDDLDEIQKHRKEAESFDEASRKQRPWMYQRDDTVR